MVLVPSAGELDCQVLSQSELDGGALEYNFLAEIPAYSVIHVDLIVHKVIEALMDILHQRGDPDDQHNPRDTDADTGSREYLQHQQILIGEKTIALDSLNSRISATSRRPTAAETNELTRLDVELKVSLYNVRQFKMQQIQSANRAF